MSFDRLWAGWRAGYVGSVAGASRATAERPGDASVDGVDCVFCAIISSTLSAEERFVVFEDETTAAVLNAYPYASGHLLVLPRSHVGALEELDETSSDALWRTTRLALRALQAAYAPDGANIGANLGRAAGAGIPDHLHLHVVPRWAGDTNFMTAVAAVRVLPEALSGSWSKVSAAWPK